MTSSSVTIACLAGDGIGPEIMSAAQHVLDQAVRHSSNGSRQIVWKNFPAGKKALTETGDALPPQTLEALRTFKLGLKGPLTTPVGGGIRSLNVRLRQELDLYVCLRHARWFEGLPSPLRQPQGLDITLFRENTEDIYTGIEYQAGTEANQRWMNAFRENHPEDYKRLPSPAECGIGIKPISRFASQRLVRAAIQWSLANGRQRLTLVHKGNIMKYTEGAFLAWGYDVAESEFGGQVITRRQLERAQKDDGKAQAKRFSPAQQKTGWLRVDDVIADVAFEQLITHPQAFDVIAATNLNGDYLSDAAAALCGGVGISPGANINFEAGMGVFEANHGSADDLAGKNLANPSSLILSGEMMLRFIGWPEAADTLRSAMHETIRSKQVTADLARQMDGASAIGTQEFANAVIFNM